MRTYLINKLLSFTVVLLCIFLTLVAFGYTSVQWQVILLAIIIFGYSHFLLGFYYQWKSFLRQPQPAQHFVTFAVLTVLSIGVAYLAFEYVGFAAALGIGFLYFLLHGLFNEQTLALRQTGTHVPLLFFVALAVFIISLLAYSTPDETFFFTPQLQFLSVNSIQVENFFTDNYLSPTTVLYLFWGGVLSSLVVVGYAWWRSRFLRLTLFLVGLFVGGSALVFYAGPPAYIYMYLLVVGYHFMTWFVFYMVEMRRRGRVAYRNFILQHIVIVAPLLYGAYLFVTPSTPDWVLLLFNYKLFVVMTYIHITTSFMNDRWLQTLQATIFARLTRSRSKVRSAPLARP